MAAQAALIQASETLCFNYAEDFWNILETPELQSSEDPCRRVGLLLCNTSYIVRCQQELHGNNQVTFNAKEMHAFYELAENV